DREVAGGREHHLGYGLALLGDRQPVLAQVAREQAHEGMGDGAAHDVVVSEAAVSRSAASNSAISSSNTSGFPSRAISRGSPSSSRARRTTPSITRGSRSG